MTDAAASAARLARVLARGIGRGIVRDSERHTLTRDETGHAPRDRCDQPRELPRARRHGGHEAKATTRLRREHAVQNAAYGSGRSDCTHFPPAGSRSRLRSRLRRSPAGGRGGDRTRVARARGSRGRGDRARDRRREGSASGTAGSGPTAGSARQEARDRRDGPPAPPSDVRHNWRTPRAPCTRTVRGARRDRRRNESVRNLGSTRRIPRTAETRVRRTAGRRRRPLRPRETSRGARGRCGGARCARRRGDGTRGSIAAARTARHPVRRPLPAETSHGHRPARAVTRSVRVDGRLWGGLRARRADVGWFSTFVLATWKASTPLPLAARQFANGREKICLTLTYASPNLRLSVIETLEVTFPYRNQGSTQMIFSADQRRRPRRLFQSARSGAPPATPRCGNSVGSRRAPSTEADRALQSERARFAASVDRELRLACRSEAALRRELGGAARAFVRRRAYRRLGFVRLSDYARERLGVSARTLQSAAWLATRLDELPAVSRAYDRSALSWAQARAICKVAVAADEERWLALARRTTVETLERLVLGARQPDGVPADPDGEPNEIDGEPAVRWRFTCPARVRALWRRALELASRAAGEPLVRLACRRDRRRGGLVGPAAGCVARRPRAARGSATRAPRPAHEARRCRSTGSRSAQIPVSIAARSSTSGMVPPSRCGVSRRPHPIPSRSMRDWSKRCGCSGPSSRGSGGCCASWSITAFIDRSDARRSTIMSASGSASRSAKRGHSSRSKRRRSE